MLLFQHLIRYCRAGVPLFEHLVCHCRARMSLFEHLVCGCGARMPLSQHLIRYRGAEVPLPQHPVRYRGAEVPLPQCLVHRCGAGVAVAHHHLSGSRRTSARRPPWMLSEHISRMPRRHFPLFPPGRLLPAHTQKPVLHRSPGSLEWYPGMRLAERPRISNPPSVS